jgi:hypothetical protein
MEDEDDVDDIVEHIKSFSRVEEITDIIILGKDGGIRRLQLSDEIDEN